MGLGCLVYLPNVLPLHWSAHAQCNNKTVPVSRYPLGPSYETWTAKLWLPSFVLVENSESNLKPATFLVKIFSKVPPEWASWLHGARALQSAFTGGPFMWRRVRILAYIYIETHPYIRTTHGLAQLHRHLRGEPVAQLELSPPRAHREPPSRASCCGNASGEAG